MVSHKATTTMISFLIRYIVSDWESHMGTNSLFLLAVTALTLTAADRLAPGTLLVADKKLDDPNFRKTVVLIADISEDGGTLGLILNRRTEMPLSQALESWKEAARVKDPIFVGGPVGRTGMFALIRLKTPGHAKRVTADIHLVTERSGLVAHLAEGPTRVRVFAGYTGWAPDQLEMEMSEGAWHVLPANPKYVFDEYPETLWLRLSHAADMQIAGMPVLKLDPQLPVVDGDHRVPQRWIPRTLTLQTCDRASLSTNSPPTPDPRAASRLLLRPALHGHWLGLAAPMRFGLLKFAGDKDGDDDAE